MLGPVGVALRNLVDVADYQNNQLARLQILLRHALHIFNRYRSNAIAVGGPIVRRAFRILILREDPSYLRRRGKVSRENFDEIVFRRLQLLAETLLVRRRLISSITISIACDVVGFFD